MFYPMKQACAEGSFGFGRNIIASIPLHQAHQIKKSEKFLTSK
jgi:hypothetical protein